MKLILRLNGLIILFFLARFFVENQILAKQSFHIQEKRIDSLNVSLRVGFLCDSIDSKEIQATYNFLLNVKNFRAVKITFNQIKDNPQILKTFNVLWYHRPDSSALSNIETDSIFITNLTNYIRQGGGLFLTLDAIKLLIPLGLEKQEPQVKYANAVDEGYGRKLGLHSFRSHPVFEGLNGGAYIWAPLKDMIVRQLGYFNNIIPQGNVVAVDWAYITLKEESKLMLEYNLGKGKILAVGAYTYYQPKNQNRKQLELFTKNCLNYLSGMKDNERVRYWSYKPLTVEQFSHTSSKIKINPAENWSRNEISLMFTARFASDNQWDIGGKRILIMGKEKGGIEEVWTHPFMALRDYTVGVQFSYSDSIYWFNDQVPQIEVRPESFTRIYKFPRAYITEIITSDVDNPIGIVHYEYRGVYPAKLIVIFKSNLRFMWPYSHKALGSIYYTWDEGLNAFVVKNETNEFYSIVGGSGVPHRKLYGRFDKFNKDGKEFKGELTDKLQAACLLEFSLKMNDNLNVFVSGTNEGLEKAVGYYKDAFSAKLIYEKAAKYYKDFLSKSLMITTPDDNFNTGYKWALIGTERFFVNTPGIGKSLVAGYSTTAHGWNGNQQVSGRPGYAWYFGRDGQWSSMAILDYGDFQKVKDVLNTYQEYQDVNGKIFHELTTSGVVHYDAADATPLYVILAGKYLKFSGDVNFIKSSWTHIKSAMDFMFSTDTDGDHLIENTNVGHGWVEGGELYGAKTTFYLAGCWSAALDAARYIAATLGYSEEAEKYEQEHQIVQQIINNSFWNTETNFFNYGLLQNNTYNTQETAMPSVPIYFEGIDSSKAYKVIDTYAGNNFTADWGVRIIGQDNPLFNPRGYHYGSIWPLFTGWTSLAEYKYGNFLQGFNHIMNNLNVYKNWNLGFVEEVLNGEQYLPSGVCSHQCWSETMVLQPILEGMLGLNANALNNKLILSPKLPANWDFINVKNIKLGNHSLNFKMEKTSDKIIYSFEHFGNNNLEIEFIPYLPKGTQIEKILIGGKEISVKKYFGRQEDFVKLFLNVNKNLYVEIFYSEGISALPIITNPKVGDYSEGFRIISTNYSGNYYSIKVEGKPKSEGTLEIFCPANNISSIINGNLVSVKKNIYNVKVVFDEKQSRYVDKEVKIKLKSVTIH
ncbi:amylo-alpha-1,6-glucosidase [Melioribacteraceae bacterium 4301-Me]|uniref:amylo-alpha-1,6-glucosidase n=1 Tax=Pyranulibacter aquaticus TaxID=3163344 RepID=UPI00359B4957